MKLFLENEKKYKQKKPMKIKYENKKTIDTKVHH
jgi:hypothetical protein